jgi:hypothetical protein
LAAIVLAVFPAIGVDRWTGVLVDGEGQPWSNL